MVKDRSASQGVLLGAFRLSGTEPILIFEFTLFFYAVNIFTMFLQKFESIEIRRRALSLMTVWWKLWSQVSLREKSKYSLPVATAPLHIQTTAQSMKCGPPQTSKSETVLGRTPSQDSAFSRVILSFQSGKTAPTAKHHRSEPAETALLQSQGTIDWSRHNVCF